MPILRLNYPPLPEQRSIVAKIESLAAKIDQIKQLRQAIRADAQVMLRSAFQQVIEGAEYHPMGEVAPIVRRPVAIEPEGEYPELGVRSFGKGTFHKPVLNGIDVGTKKLYHIHPGDLVLSNVFAWEGAIAVVQPGDIGRVGSHRFITCVAKMGVATPEFLYFYLLTDEGIEKVREASPGGAGRNRTLGLKKLEKIQAPIPPFDKQLRFNRLQERAAAITRTQADNQAELDALLPAILDRAFKGEL
ncbi:MAG: type I restriction enzyme, S subunit [Candidatus Kentron sp. G]|nr:MAG: type I restriction enzyme, S subunit [Candidatus Kentron sp. G]VFN05085.1 MAG: type I restriction enzyme, S subunit [Candidatus Kentron sp. G]VFN06396.1 MAG: type I restriction enzyme, S subunit [Candidatus Kentron sp. G]